MIYIITGNTGAGKTTHALALKRELKAVVFSIDHWNNVLFLDDKQEADGVSWFLDRIERSDQMIQSLCIQLNDIEIDAILDLGFAKHARRERFYAFAKANNIPLKVHFLDIPYTIRKQQVAHRNLEKGTTYEFQVSDQDFEFMETWFEPLTELERREAVIFN